MKKTLYVLAFVCLTASFSKAQIYLAKEASIQFFSKTAMEDIDGTNTSGRPIMDVGSGDVQIKLTMRGFKFKSAFMEEHFNENFLETEKFPHAIFKGKLNEKIDFKKDGENKATVTGVMEIHGVKQTVTLAGTLTVKGNQVIIDSKFMIKLADYNIKDPSLIGTKIAESVEVTVKSVLEPYKKP